jgi:hypothetical protein
MAKKEREKTAKKPRKMQIDFTGVEGKKGARRVPEGDYLMEIADYSVDHKKDDETNQFVKVEYKILQGPTKGSWNEIFNLGKTSLWRLRNFLEAVGFTIPSSAVSVPFEKLIGRKVAMTIGDDEYEGKTRSKAQDYFSAKDFEALGEETTDEDEDEEDEDEESTTEAATADDEDEDEELELVDDDI